MVLSTKHTITVAAGAIGFEPHTPRYHLITSGAEGPGRGRARGDRAIGVAPLTLRPNGDLDAESGSVGR